VLELIVKSKLLLNIELKTDVIHYENIEKDVIDLIKKYDMENRIIISSFYHESIRICKNIDDNIKCGLLYHRPIENIIERAKELGAEALHPNVELLNEEFVKKAHENNLKINTYTVNSPRIMRRLLKNKVDGAFSDYPELLKEIIKEG
jgi:glycerophosphoryl diester phosphodiesterase